MKTTISTLLATLAITFTASAAPTLRIETSIAGLSAKGAREVLSKPTVIVESGKNATIKHGNLEFSLTPTLCDNGTVDIQTVITEHKGKNAETLATPRMIVQLGKVAEIKIGQIAFTAQPSLAK